ALTVSGLYSRELFDRWRIEQMACHFTQVLEAMTESPDDDVDQVDLVTAESPRPIAAAAGSTPRPLARVDVAFDEWVQRTPHAPAVLGVGQQLTYRELHDRATHLAGRLRALGAGPGAIVGIAVRRSPAMV